MTARYQRFTINKKIMKKLIIILFAFISTLAFSQGGVTTVSNEANDLVILIDNGNVKVFSLNRDIPLTGTRIAHLEEESELLEEDILSDGFMGQESKEQGTSKNDASIYVNLANIFVIVLLIGCAVLLLLFLICITINCFYEKMRKPINKKPISKKFIRNIVHTIGVLSLIVIILEMFIVKQFAKEIIMGALSAAVYSFITYYYNRYIKSDEKVINNQSENN